MGGYSFLVSILAGRSSDSKLADPLKSNFLDVVKKLPTDRAFKMSDYCPAEFKTMNVTSTLKRYELIRKVGRERPSYSGYLWKTTEKHAALMRFLKGGKA